MVLHYGDLIDGNCLVKIINETKPTEIYNLGAQSHVKVRKFRVLSSLFLFTTGKKLWYPTLSYRYLSQPI
jgi:hypothetical protein